MILDGRKLANRIFRQLKKEIEKLPRLTVGAVLVGVNPASESFLKQKSKVAKLLGVSFKVFKFSQKIKTEKFKKEISKLNRNKNVNGIIVQLPLPRHIDADEILGAVNPKKDIDALSAKSPVLAPTIEAVKYVFDKYKINYKNKNILIVGRGRLVGQPIYRWLVPQHASRKIVELNKVKIIDVRQKRRLSKLARQADIIIGGAGKAGLINGNIIKKNAILIDFGFSREGGKISGDFNFSSCSKKAKLITPVPGGMGPIMVAMLFKNLFKLNKL
jgi:methylenetetrahydrofolate dehydrogenase (NADP+)/methenyltetrahydrofolate cyclohydrolase